MLEQPKAYTTELHETATKIESLDPTKQVDVGLKDGITKLKEKAKEKSKMLTVMMDNVLKGDKKNELADITDKIKNEFNFEKYTVQIDLLDNKIDQAKKNEVTKALTELIAEFDKLDSYKGTMFKKAAPETDGVSKEKSKTDLERKQKIILDIAGKDTKVKGWVDTLSTATELKDTPYMNKVLSTIYEKVHNTVSDQVLKGQFERTFDALKKDSQNMPLRLNFLKILHSIPATERNMFSEEQIVAAENLWRIRVNKDTGPDGKRNVPTVPLSMLNLTEVQGSVDTSLIPVETLTQENNTNTQVENNNNKQPAAVDNSSEKLDWARDKEKIIDDAYKSFLKAAATPVDIKNGSLTFKAMGKDFVLSHNEIQFGTRKTHYKITATKLFMSAEVFPQMISVSNSQINLSVEYVDPISGKRIQEKNVLEEKKVKILLEKSIAALKEFSENPENFAFDPDGEGRVLNVAFYKE